MKADALERRINDLEEQVAAIHGDRYLDRLSDQADRIKALEDASPKPPEQKGEVIAEAAGETGSAGTPSNDRGCGGEQPDLTMRQFDTGWYRVDGRVWCSLGCRHAQRCVKGNAKPAPPKVARAICMHSIFDEDGTCHTCGDVVASAFPVEFAEVIAAMQHPPKPAAPEPPKSVARPLAGGWEVVDWLRYKIFHDCPRGGHTPAPFIGRNGKRACESCAESAGVFATGNPCGRCQSVATGPVRHFVTCGPCWNLWHDEVEARGLEKLEPRYQELRAAHERLKDDNDKLRGQVAMTSELEHLCAQRHGADKPAPSSAVDDLQCDLREAQDNITRMTIVYRENEVTIAKLEADNARLIRERVDIGNRLDLHMADCKPSSVVVRWRALGTQERRVAIQHLRAVDDFRTLNAADVLEEAGKP